MEFVTPNPDWYFINPLITTAKLIALLSGFFAVTGLVIYVAGVVLIWRQETRLPAGIRKMEIVVAPGDRHSPKTA